MTTISTEPRAQLAHLAKADGSATFSYGGYTVVGSVNGPIEAAKKDEDTLGAVLEVLVRPAAGVGGTHERYVEGIVRTTLTQVIPLEAFPRCSVQVTLQVLETPPDDYTNTQLGQAQQNLPVIPPLLHTAMLALLTAAIPLDGIATASLVAVLPSGVVVADPPAADLRTATSLHVLAYSSRRRRAGGGSGKDEGEKQRPPQLLALSEGSFTVPEFDEVTAVARTTCCGMGEDDGKIVKFMRAAVEELVQKKLAWQT